jgi:hypothetical protein
MFSIAGQPLLHREPRRQAVGALGKALSRRCNHPVTAHSEGAMQNQNNVMFCPMSSHKLPGPRFQERA